jgi:hypothetical protein
LSKSACSANIFVAFTINDKIGKSHPPHIEAAEGYLVVFIKSCSISDS